MASTITALTGGGGVAVAGDTSGVLELKTNNGTTAMTIDTSQNVGIGTTTVGYPLDIRSSGGANGIHLSNSGTQDTGAYINATGDAEVMFSGGANYNSYSAPNFVMTAKATVASGVYCTGDTVRFWVNTGLTVGNTFNQTERMRIGSTGYVTNAVNGLGNGLVQAQQYYRLDSGLAGANVNTAQNIFGVGVTLVGSTVYEFEMVVSFTKTAGTTSHTLGFGFGGTATLNNIYYQAIGGDTSGGLTMVSGATVLTWGASQSASNTVFTRAITNASEFITAIIKGTVSVNAGGTFIPQYTLSAAPGGAYTTSAGSYIKIAPLSASGANTSIGTWA